MCFCPCCPDGQPLFLPSTLCPPLPQLSRANEGFILSQFGGFALLQRVVNTTDEVAAFRQQLSARHGRNVSLSYTLVNATENPEAWCVHYYLLNILAPTHPHTHSDPTLPPQSSRGRTF